MRARFALDECRLGKDRAFRALLALIAAANLGATGCGGDGESDKGARAALKFLDLRVEDISDTRAVVRFGTNVEATCEVEYGTSNKELSLVATDPSMTPGAFSLTHEVPLEDLLPDTLYFYRAKATDPSGITTRSEASSFTTVPPVSPPGLTNVALSSMGTTITGVSSSYGNTPSFSALNAIDGSMSTEWATAGDGDKAFVELDFGQPRTISRFGFRSRSMTDGSSIIQTTRLVLPDATTQGPFESPDPTQHYLFDLPQPLTTQTIRIEAVKTTGGNTGAKEVELYAAN